MVNAADLLEFCPIAMDQELHNYYMDWKAIISWQGTVLTKFKNLHSPQYIRDRRTAFPRIPNGGWHFSWMGNVERVIQKMTSIVEGKEYSEKEKRLTERSYVKNMIDNGRLFWFSDERAQMLPCEIESIKLPYIKEFVKKYPQFLKPKD